MRFQANGGALEAAPALLTEAEVPATAPAPADAAMEVEAAGAAAVPVVADAEAAVPATALTPPVFAAVDQGTPGADAAADRALAGSRAAAIAGPESTEWLASVLTVDQPFNGPPSPPGLLGTLPEAALERASELDDKAAKMEASEGGAAPTPAPAAMEAMKPQDDPSVVMKAEEAVDSVVATQLTDDGGALPLTSEAGTAVKDENADAAAAEAAAASAQAEVRAARAQVRNVLSSCPCASRSRPWCTLATKSSPRACPCCLPLWQRCRTGLPARRHPQALTIRCT